MVGSSFVTSAEGHETRTKLPPPAPLLAEPAPPKAGADAGELTGGAWYRLLVPKDGAEGVAFPAVATGAGAYDCGSSSTADGLAAPPQAPAFGASGEHCSFLLARFD
jgi:hypothetical protein